MLFSPVRRKNRTTVIHSPLGSGKKSTAAELGMCVKTIVLINPNFRANGPAKMVEKEESK
jgi:hypothetical protein